MLYNYKKYNIAEIGAPPVGKQSRKASENNALKAAENKARKRRKIKPK